jgi:hypothetical protein
MFSPPGTTTMGAVAVVLAVVLASTIAVSAAPASATEDSTPAQTADRIDGDVTQADLASLTDPASQTNASVRTWRVPHFVDAANATASELEAYRNAEARDATDDPAPRPVTPGDRLAVAISVDGLDAQTESETGNRTERVLAALDDLGHFSIQQTQDTTTPEMWPATLWLNASNVRAVDAGTDRYVLVVDQSSALAAKIDPFDDDPAAVYAAENDTPSFYGLYRERAAAQAFTARFYENDTFSGLVAASDPVDFPAAAISLAADGPLTPGANATITGTTTLAPDSTLELSVVNDTGATVATATTTVAADRTVALALSLATPPATLTIDAAVASEYQGPVSVDAASVRVSEPDASVTLDDQTTTTRYVSARANLSHGGVLVLRNETTVLDTSTRLASGSHQTVTFTLPASATNGSYSVLAYRGTPGDRGEPYPDGTATARIEIATDGAPGETPSDPDATQTTGPPTETTTEPPATATAASTTAQSTTAAPGTDTATEDGAIPGFGTLVALAALAITGCALALGRRRRTGDA